MTDKGNEVYELVNLLGLLMRVREHANGDWFAQVVTRSFGRLRELGVVVIENNFGDHFKLDEFWEKWDDGGVR